MEGLRVYFLEQARRTKQELVSSLGLGISLFLLGPSLLPGRGERSISREVMMAWSERGCGNVSFHFRSGFN
jgi:hypothetical protein